ncbi:hypothetical protein H7H48_08425 [Nitratireductor sp. B36]|uniref:hypothetical protein n=1 Tax=Nitratireductor TaxID=245876 RepID=UPI001E320E59|nr:hypothetical protein [Nitratireductor sp. B36]MCC5779074.1 hypothetical protein [Nitratireductor sp. B36]
MNAKQTRLVCLRKALASSPNLHGFATPSQATQTTLAGCGSTIAKADLRSLRKIFEKRFRARLFFRQLPEQARF